MNGSRIEYGLGSGREKLVCISIPRRKIQSNIFMMMILCFVFDFGASLVTDNLSSLNLFYTLQLEFLTWKNPHWKFGWGLTDSHVNTLLVWW